MSFAPLFLALAAAIFAGTSVITARRQRVRALRRLQAEWGKPSLRTRNLHAIGDYYRSRVDASESSEFLDERTWNDLDLDTVFAVLDRAESTLGQQVLYYR